jgi:anhydro-N-acetylmuramic acid kinase
LGQWQFRIVDAETIPYPEEWRNQLLNATQLGGRNLAELHVNYGSYLGQKAIEFIKDKGLHVDLVSSHGHTLFHAPESGFTYQLGEGQAIASISDLHVVCDFRAKDISLGGQGAPLVPIGDELLFNEYEACLNIGGIANISFNENGRRLAFDICPANQMLNTISRETGKEFDEDGMMARAGSPDPQLFDTLQKDPYYQRSFPKSLSNEYVRKYFLTLLSGSDIPERNKLRTATEHIAYQVRQATESIEPGTILVTGGGAHNLFLMECLRESSKHEFVVPDNQLVDFKEALVFGFLGVLRIRGDINCLASVTGASKDSCIGVVYTP